MQPLSARRRAFTLIEILVVVAIIALLAGLLFPVFSRAREEGRKTSCLNNMRQLGIAFQQYASDSRGKYPLAANFQAWGVGKGHWVAGTPSPIASPNDPTYALAALAPNASDDFPATGRSADVENGALFPYVKSTAIYICPSDRDGEVKHLSYTMNCALASLSASRIRSPGDIVLLVDEGFATDGFFWAVNTTAVTGLGTSTDRLAKRHNGGGNMLFADGHVKYYSFESFPLDATPQGLANKWKTGGSPRFHDRSFGPYGSSMPPGTGVTPDYCFATAGPGTADGTTNIP